MVALNILTRCTKRTALLLVGAAACLSAGGLAAQAQSKDSVTISVVLAMSGNEWSTEVQAGANAAAAEFGDKVKLRFTGPPAIDPPRQAQMFLSELDTQPDALVVVNIAPPLFTQPAQEAASRGAKVAWINVPPTADVPGALLISADAYGMGQAGGKIVADALEAKLGKPAAEVTGDVVTGICVVGLTVVENRLAGHLDALRTRFPKINVIDKFQSESDRTRNFALWDEAIRTRPNALTYVDPCEQGEVNIPMILGTDKIDAPFVSYDTPEEIRADIAAGSVLAAIPSNFFSQAYLAVHLLADSMLTGKPLPSGWLKVPTVTIDKSNIAAYTAAWEDPEKGLKAFYDNTLTGLLKNMPTDLPPTAEFVAPKR